MQSITGVKSQLQELATALVDIDDHDKVHRLARANMQLACTVCTDPLLALDSPAQVPGCRDLFKDLLHLENELNMHIQALQGTKQTYKASEQSTDFKAILERKMQQLLASHQCVTHAWMGCCFACILMQVLSTDELQLQLSGQHARRFFHYPLAVAMCCCQQV